MGCACIACDTARFERAPAFAQSRAAVHARMCLAECKRTVDAHSYMINFPGDDGSHGIFYETVSVTSIDSTIIEEAEGLTAWSPCKALQKVNDA